MDESAVGSAGQLGVAEAGDPSQGVPESAPAEGLSDCEQVHPGGDPGRAQRELGRILREQIIEQVPIAALKPRARNARRHPRKQIEQLAASIREFGFIGAVVGDNENNVLAGHGRLEAAKVAGLTSIPFIRVAHLDEARKIAFALADNRLSELSTWDDEILKVELKELESLSNVAIELTGFDTADLDSLLGPEPDPYGPDEVVPEPELDKPAVSQKGDLWLLGEHRLLCGDALNPDDYDRLLEGERATQIITDPPYNVAIGGHVSSKGFREFAMASGEMSRPQFTEFNLRYLKNCQSVAREGAIFHVFMDWRHTQEVTTAAEAAELKVMNLCIWVKSAAGMGAFYRSQHELVFVLKHGTAPHTNNFGLGARGRNRSNVWQYPAAVRGQRRGVADPEHGHPTPKPVALILDALKDCSNRGDVVLDPFAGSGTLAIAAERIERKARMMELDPHYVDLDVRRWQAITGQKARLSTGQSFAEVQTARADARQPALGDVSSTWEKSRDQKA